MRRIKIGTRGSSLAMNQAYTIQQLLKRKGWNSEIIPIKTRGDIDSDSPFSQMISDGSFVRDIEKELLAGKVDIGVHRAEDLPYALSPGLAIAGLPKADDHRDMLIMRPSALVEEKRPYIIGTDNPRRRSEYGRLDANAEFKDIRGELATRIEKLDAGEYDGLIVAKAATDRLDPDLSRFYLRIMEESEMITSPGQGILAVECKENDPEMMQFLGMISDTAAERRFKIERELFCALTGDPSIPIGGYADIRHRDDITIHAMYNGNRTLAVTNLDDASSAIEKIADELR